MLEVKAIPPSSELELLHLLQTVGNGGKKSIGQTLFCAHEKNGKVRPYLLEPGAERDLFVAGETGTYDGEVLVPYQGSLDGLIYRKD